MTAREAAARARDPLVTALLTLIVNGALYLVTVRDDIRDTRALVREMRCEVAVGFRKPTLPEGCSVNAAALHSNGVTQAGESRP